MTKNLLYIENYIIRENHEKKSLDHEETTKNSFLRENDKKIIPI